MKRTNEKFIGFDEDIINLLVELDGMSIKDEEMEETRKELMTNLQKLTNELENKIKESECFNNKTYDDQINISGLTGVEDR